MSSGSQLRPLEVHDGFAQVRPDTDPDSIVPTLARAEPEPRVQFDERLSEPALAGIAAALEVRPTLHLRVYGRSVDPSLEFLERFRRARHLSVDLWSATSFDLLGDFEDLESLSLGETKTKSVSLAFMRRLDKLTDVSVEAHHKDVEAVGDLPRLRRLFLRVPRAKSLDWLAGHESLRVFEMHFGGIRDLTPLAEIPGLRGLALYQVRKLDTADLDALSGMERLEGLSLGALRNVERLRFLTGGPSRTLRYLTLERLLGLQTLDDLGGCVALEELYLDSDVRPADRRIDPLARLPTLKYAQINPALPSEQIESLANSFKGKTLMYRGEVLHGSSADRGILHWRRPVSDYIK